MLALVSIKQGDPPLVDVAEIQLGRLAQERPGKRKRQQAERGRPQQEQEPVGPAGCAASAGAASATGT